MSRTSGGMSIHIGSPTTGTNHGNDIQKSRSPQSAHRGFQSASRNRGGDQEGGDRSAGRRNESEDGQAGSRRRGGGPRLQARQGSGVSGGGLQGSRNDIAQGHRRGLVRSAAPSGGDGSRFR